MANLLKRNRWKGIKLSDFNDARKKYFGQHLDKNQVYEIFTEMGFNKSHYLVVTLTESHIIVQNHDGTYSFSQEGGITEPLLQETGRLISKKDAPKSKNIGKWSEEKMLKALLSIKNEDGNPKYEIRRRVPARWEDVTL